MPQYKVTLKDEQQKSPDAWLLTFQGTPTWIDSENVVFDAPDDFEANLYVEPAEIKSPPTPLTNDTTT